MARPTISQIENAFQPAREALKPERFAGRQEQLTDAYRAMLSDGANIALIGGRGIGKTSLAKQLLAIASGDQSLLHRLNIPADKPCDFLAFYFSCGANTENLDNLLESLLTSESGLKDWIYDIPEAKRVTERLTGSGNISILTIGAGKTTERSSRSAATENSLELIFTNVATKITQATGAKNGLFLIIDEFDRIDDPTGIGPFLKGVATNAPMVKFCIVGVSHDIHMLMKEHESSDRLFAGAVVRVPPMTSAELSEIIDIAEDSIDKAIRFSDEARTRLVNLANGHPYMVHLIGKFALRRAHEHNQEIIEDDDILQTIDHIASTGRDPALEGRYMKAIASSPQRETVLHALAENVSGDSLEAHTTSTYRICLDRGVENPSQYVGHLASNDYGSEITKVRERYYRFRDTLFHTYVLVRPPVFPPQQAE